MLNVKTVLLIFFICLAVILALLSPKTVFAQVVINEFQIKPDQWIELYNSSGGSVDISGWIIDDDGGTEKYIITSGIMILPKKCMSFQSGSFNWNTTSGDAVRLLDSGLSSKEEYHYNSAPGEGVSIGKATDGEGDFVVLQNSSRDKFNTTGESCLAPSPTLTPTPILTTVPSPTPTLTSTPTAKATYKINKTKDDSGVELSSVKIYVDDVYIHHLDEEVLTFCSGCHCDDEHLVDCELGQHTIRLEKDDYQNWQESKTLSAGDTFEVNPTMAKVSPSSTLTPVPPTSTPTVKVNPTATKTPTPRLSITPTPKEAVLGEEATQEGGFHLSGGVVQGDESENVQLPGQDKEKKSVFPFKISWSIALPFVAVIIGVGFISFSVVSFLKSRKHQETMV